MSDGLGLIIIVLFLILVFIVIDYFVIRAKTKPTKYDGQMVITVLENSRKIFSLEELDDPEELERKEFIVLKVIKTDIVDID